MRAKRFRYFVTTILASALILTGSGLFYIALGQFMGLTYSRTAVIAIIATVLGSLLFFTYRVDSFGTRMITLSLGATLLIFLLMYQLGRMRNTSLRFSADLMLLSFLIYGIFMIARTVIMALQPQEALFNNSPIQSATYLLLFAISFFWSTGFILMEIATIDVLTRIPNRRATQAFLEKEISRAQRSRDEFTILVDRHRRFQAGE